MCSDGNPKYSVYTVAIGDLHAIAVSYMQKLESFCCSISSVNTHSHLDCVQSSLGDCVDRGCGAVVYTHCEMMSISGLADRTVLLAVVDEVPREFIHQICVHNSLLFSQSILGVIN
jgi:hypothetical protein